MHSTPSMVNDRKTKKKKAEEEEDSTSVCGHQVFQNLIMSFDPLNARYG